MAAGHGRVAVAFDPLREGGEAPRWSARCALPGLFARPAAGAGDRAERGDDRSSLISENHLRHGTELVWLEDVFHLDYGRQSLGRLPTADCRLVQASRRTAAMAAWSAAPFSGPMPHPPAPAAPFRRRVFWLLPHDRDEEPDGLYAGSVPAGAVDPETLQPTVKGRRTERGEGGEGGSSVPGDAGNSAWVSRSAYRSQRPKRRSFGQRRTLLCPRSRLRTPPAAQAHARTQPSCLADEFRVRVTFRCGRERERVGGPFGHLVRGARASVTNTRCGAVRTASCTHGERRRTPAQASTASPLVRPQPPSGTRGTNAPEPTVPGAVVAGAAPGRRSPPRQGVGAAPGRPGAAPTP
ncbi:DUF6009 family protein [Streptomyces sp. NPDC090084]|uniref:DUF6009 family protein n=1 Tax=Streptomyces sp. NPDC090084 TaxID=3365942 RepID=UPI003836274E